jgi:hypothetical protein
MDERCEYCEARRQAIAAAKQTGWRTVELAGRTALYEHLRTAHGLDATSAAAIAAG